MHEEKLIDGVLHWRPYESVREHENAGWQPYTIEELSERVLRLEKQLTNIRRLAGT